MRRSFCLILLAVPLCAFQTILFLLLNRDVGVKAIENLMEKRGKFDYILLETTGLADPGSCISVTGFGRVPDR